MAGLIQDRDGKKTPFLSRGKMGRKNRYDEPGQEQMMQVIEKDSHLSGQEDGKKRPAKRRVAVSKRTLKQPDSVAIRLLSKFSMMTQEQMLWAMGCSERSLRRALFGLRHEHLVCTGALLPEGYSIEETDKPKQVLSLNKDGVEFVEHFGCSHALFNRKPIARSWNGGFIQDDEARHKLGIVDCMIALSKFVDRFPHLEIVYMAPDFVTVDDGISINKSDYVRTVKRGGKEAKKEESLIPDIIASVFNKERGTTREFYIEYCRGTEPVWMSPEAIKKARQDYNKRKETGRAMLSVPLSERFANYNTFFNDPNHKTTETDPSILWVCENDEALRRIRASERIEWSKFDNIIDRTFLATIDDVKSDFLGAHWHLPDSDEIGSPVNLAKLERNT